MGDKERGGEPTGPAERPVPTAADVARSLHVVATDLGFEVVDTSDKGVVSFIVRKVHPKGSWHDTWDIHVRGAEDIPANEGSGFDNPMGGPSNKPFMLWAERMEGLRFVKKDLTRAKAIRWMEKAARRR